jgi:hypothetical protein
MDYSLWQMKIGTTMKRGRRFGSLFSAETLFFVPFSLPSVSGNG